MTDINNTSGNFLVQNQTTQGKSGPQSPDKVRAAAEEFEAFFLSQFLNSMSAGVETNDTFGGGESEKIFRSMLNDEYSKSMSRQGGVGIADVVYREMLALQEI
ncbi:MAG: rod-binding protein [Sneathiella sp.]|nr:rod-binding protein [Sneathiella sp.]